MEIAFKFVTMAGGWLVTKRRRQEGVHGKIKEQRKGGKGKEKLGSEEEVED